MFPTDPGRCPACNYPRSGNFCPYCAAAEQEYANMHGPHGADFEDDDIEERRESNEWRKLRSDENAFGESLD